MPSALYITAPEPGAGKTALCAGIALALQRTGKAVGYFKPVVLAEDAPRLDLTDADVEFLRAALKLPEPAAALIGVGTAPARLGRLAAGSPELAQVQEAYSKAAQGKDIMVVEGLSGNADGASQAIAQRLGARVIVVAPYKSTSTVDSIVQASAVAGAASGVVLNKVPPSRLELVQLQLVPGLLARGVKLLGLVPQDRSLEGVSVGELADYLGGQFLACPDGKDKLVEAVMVGAWTPDSGLYYFERRNNKAAISKGDRPDMHMAAMETSTSCLVVTKNIRPMHRVVNTAEEKGIPIVMVRGETLDVMLALEGLFPLARFRHAQKVERMAELLPQHVKLEALTAG